MLPSPFGSAPPASLASRSRAGARVRAGAVSSVLTNGLEHGCVPVCGARLPIRRCQPAPQARTTDGPVAAQSAATVQSYLPLCARSSRARHLVGCAGARPPLGGAALGASTGREGQPRRWGALGNGGHASPRPSRCRLGLCCARSGETAGGGSCRARGAGSRARIPSPTPRGWPGCACRRPSVVASVPALRGGWAGPGGVCTHRGSSLASPLGRRRGGQAGGSLRWQGTARRRWPRLHCCTVSKARLLTQMCRVTAAPGAAAK